MSYRWTTHRFFDAAGNDRRGLAALSLWRAVKAAAEETLQGGPLVPSWLKLFESHLSEHDKYWLRWRGDLAESAEIRRSYSGLYGRFFARALLSQHLSITKFVSLKRNLTTLQGFVTVSRIAKGDIPDWIAWNPITSRFVLCEAKGSLSSADFLSPGCPKCVTDGKLQFNRVETKIGGRTIQPERWVAASRWSTDHRAGRPITLLWDPPSDDFAFSDKDAAQHFKAIKTSWLNSLAPAFGARSADELLSSERRVHSIVIRAEPGPIPSGESWQPDDNEERLIGEVSSVAQSSAETRIRVAETMRDDLSDSDVYRDRRTISPREIEKNAHEAVYIGAVASRFGVRPILSQSDVENLKREQAMAIDGEQPFLVLGIPVDFRLDAPPSSGEWADGAGIAQEGDLAVFDLRRVSFRASGSS